MEEQKKNPKPQKRPFAIRFLRFIAWPITYLMAPSQAIIRGAGKEILPTKVPAEQIKLFTGLTPADRWEVARDIHGWTDAQLADERKISYWLSYLFIAVSIGIFLSIVLSLKYLTIIQAISYLAYSVAFFLLFAKKSMRVYAIDRQQIILLGDWLKMPSIWLPASWLHI